MTRNLEQPHYFAGEFLAASDYATEQDYQARLRHAHDGVLHTWGIATGLQVSLTADQSGVIVSPGVAVTPEGQLVTLTQPRELAIPPLGGLLVLSLAEKRIEPREPNGLPRILEEAELSWEPSGSSSGEPRLVLVEASPGPTLEFSVRRYTGMEVGSLRFVSPLLPRKHEPMLVGWSAGQDHGVRISVDELRVTPSSAQGEAVVSLQGGMLGIGTTQPGAPLDVREPNAPLAGPGLISSHGTLVTSTDPGLGRLLTIGDSILTRDRQGQQAQSTVSSVLPDGRVVTATPLDAQDAQWQFRRKHVARFASPDESALLTCDASAQVQIGRESPGTPARLMVSGGDIQLRSGAVCFQEDGRVRSLSGAQELRFNQREGFLALRTSGPLRLRASSPPITPPVGLFLATSSNVGLGTESPGDKLVVEGAIRSMSDKQRGIAGGFVFPDGTVQLTAEASIPIGGIIDWWRPNTQVQIPDEYRVCDGSVVDDEDSPFLGQTLPALTSRFIRGVVTLDAIGSGGSFTHSHDYMVPRHTHPFPHTHPDYSGLSGGANDNDGPANELASTYCARGHSHTFRAQIFSSETVDTAANNTAGSWALTEPASNIPPNIGLLKLIRIK